jgi:hypothetical protein
MLGSPDQLPSSDSWAPLTFARPPCKRTLEQRPAVTRGTCPWARFPGPSQSCVPCGRNRPTQAEHLIPRIYHSKGCSSPGSDHPGGYRTRFRDQSGLGRGRPGSALLRRGMMKEPMRTRLSPMFQAQAATPTRRRTRSAAARRRARASTCRTLQSR